MAETAKESISNRGGKRVGAGRKPSTLKGIVKRLPRESAELLLLEINAHKKFMELANCGDPGVEFQVLKFIWEQARGKAAQAILVSDNTRDIDFGDLPMPAESGAAGKPN